MADTLNNSDNELAKLVAEQARDDHSFGTDDPDGEAAASGELDDDKLDDDALDDDELDEELVDADVYDEDGELTPELVELNEDLEDEADDVIGEDDDNPFEDPDDALPDDREEHAMEQYNKREASLGEEP